MRYAIGMQLPCQFYMCSKTPQNEVYEVLSATSTKALVYVRSLKLGFFVGIQVTYTPMFHGMFHGIRKTYNTYKEWL